VVPGHFFQARFGSVGDGRGGCLMPISKSLATCCVSLELRSLHSPGITRLHRYYEPLRHPSAPSLSLACVRLIIPDHAVGLPVLRTLSLCTCSSTTPVQRLGVVFARLTQPCQPSTNPLSARPAHRSFRGLLGVHLRCGPHTRTVLRDGYPRASDISLPPSCPGCFRLERLAGWDSHPLESAAFSRRTREATVGRTAGTGGLADVQERQAW
jgi:hypothetical protein